MKYNQPANSLYEQITLSAGLEYVSYIPYNGVWHPLKRGRF